MVNNLKYYAVVYHMREGGLLLSKKTCAKCGRELSSSQFGELCDNEERVFIPDNTCIDCRHLESSFNELYLSARRNEGRYFAWGATQDTIKLTKKVLASELEKYYEFPSDFLLEVLAKLVLSTSYSNGGSYSEREIKGIFDSLLEMHNIKK